MTHLFLLTLFALAVGAVLAGMLRQEPREAIRLALWIAGGLLAVAVVLGWTLYLLASTAS